MSKAKVNNYAAKSANSKNLLFLFCVFASYANASIIITSSILNSKTATHQERMYPFVNW